ncbi:MAG: hypothetical protein R3F29_07320 [Planctomycetota bacterium]
MSPSSVLFVSMALVATPFLLAPQEPVTQDPVKVEVEKSRSGEADDFAKELRAIRSSLLNSDRAAVVAAVARVRALESRIPDDDARADWTRLARLVAIRVGDRQWLETLREDHDLTRTEIGYAVMLARSQVEHANLEEAQRTLAQLGNIDGENEREKRRVYALRARVAELQGDVAGERHHIEDIVDHLHMWPRQRCQECHAPSKQPDVVAGFDLRGSWIGERYVALMKQQGDAEQVRAGAAADLTADPDDDDARIHLAFALRALGRDAEAEPLFEALPWVILPGRELPKPRQMATYP